MSDDHPKWLHMTPRRGAICIFSLEWFRSVLNVPEQVDLYLRTDVEGQIQLKLVAREELPEEFSLPIVMENCPYPVMSFDQICTPRVTEAPPRELASMDVAELRSLLESVRTALYDRTRQ